MAVNEVVVNGVKELSLVNDTVSEDTLLEGEIAHDASGNQITGKLFGVPVDSELSSESENAIQNKAVVAGINNAVNDVKEYANGIISNPNLLDNWYFADPINQRGQTEHTGRRYTIDRWFKNAANTVRLTDDGVQLVESGSLIRQRIATDLERFLVGKEVTLTVLLSDGNLFTANTIFPNKAGVAFEVQGNTSMSFYWDGECQNAVFTAQEASVTIEAAKLELGSIQTLAHKDTDGNWVLNDPPPNPATELAKCKWYYQRIEQARIRACGYTANSILFFISYPEMRIGPTATINGSPTISNMEIASYNDFTCSVDWALPTGCRITAAKTAHGLTDGLLHINSDSNVYIELSADL